MSALEELAARLRADGGLLAGVVHDQPGGQSLVVEAVREGWQLHYADGRVVRTDDPDLALLAGDRLYALALAELAERGDLEAVRVLADLISACAQAAAEDDPAAAQSAWERSSTALGAR